MGYCAPWHRVPCPRSSCAAPAGRRCFTANGNQRREPHEERYELARQLVPQEDWQAHWRAVRSDL